MLVRKKVDDEFLGGEKVWLMKWPAYLGLGGEAVGAMYLWKGSFLDDVNKTVSEICCSKCLIKSRFQQKQAIVTINIEYNQYTENILLSICQTHGVFETSLYTWKYNIFTWKYNIHESIIYTMYVRCCALTWIVLSNEL